VPGTVMNSTRVALLLSLSLSPFACSSPAAPDDVPMVADSGDNDAAVSDTPKPGDVVGGDAVGGDVVMPPAYALPAGHLLYRAAGPGSTTSAQLASTGPSGVGAARELVSWSTSTAGTTYELSSVAFSSQANEVLTGLYANRAMRITYTLSRMDYMGAATRDLVEVVTRGAIYSIVAGPTRVFYATRESSTVDDRTGRIFSLPLDAVASMNPVPSQLGAAEDSGCDPTQLFLTSEAPPRLITNFNGGSGCMRPSVSVYAADGVSAAPAGVTGAGMASPFLGPNLDFYALAAASSDMMRIDVSTVGLPPAAHSMAMMVGSLSSADQFASPLVLGSPQVVLFARGAQIYAWEYRRAGAMPVLIHTAADGMAVREIHWRAM